MGQTSARIWRAWKTKARNFSILAPLPPTSTATTRFIRRTKTAASEIWADLSDGVRADIQAANEHYAQYEGKVQDAATKVNDTYLKAFSEESGVQSYGEAADLLIAWYLKQA